LFFILISSISKGKTQAEVLECGLGQGNDGHHWNASEIEGSHFVHFGKFPNYNNRHTDHYLGGYAFKQMN